MYCHEDMAYIWTMQKHTAMCSNMLERTDIGVMGITDKKERHSVSDISEILIQLRVQVVFARWNDC